MKLSDTVKQMELFALPRLIVVSLQVQYELHSNLSAEKELKAGKENQGMRSNQSSISNSRLDRRYNLHNSYLKSDMDKPKGILTNRKTDAPRGE